MHTHEDTRQGERITIRLNPDELAALEARRDGRTLSETVRDVLQDGLGQREHQQLAASIARDLGEWQAQVGRDLAETRACLEPVARRLAELAVQIAACSDAAAEARSFAQLAAWQVRAFVKVALQDVARKDAYRHALQQALDQSRAIAERIRKGEDY
jgi:hypothetical protein